MRYQKGGFGGWPRETIVGSAWNPPQNNTAAQLTAASSHANHFKLSPDGVLVGGIQPAVPEMYGPGMHQTNTLVPALPIGALGSAHGNKVGGKRRMHSLKRSAHKRNGHKRSAHKRRAHKRSAHKRSAHKRITHKRHQNGGFVFGGFPQVIGTAWDNTVNGVKNTVNAYNGVKLLPSASGWDQPELLKGSPVPSPKPILASLDALKQAADQRVANV